MPFAYGYLRVSTSDQTTAQQREPILEHYRQHLQGRGFEWGRQGSPEPGGWFVDEDTSGGVPLANREAGFRLGLTAEKGDAVIVWKLDRAFRNTVDCLQTAELWAAQGIELHVLGLPLGVTNLSTPEGRVMLTVAAAFAQWERALISERLTASKRYLRAQGRKYCRDCTPYGFYWQGRAKNARLKPDHKTREFARQVIAWRDQGWTWERIYWHALRAGLRRPPYVAQNPGGEWSIQTMYQIHLHERAAQAREAAEASAKALLSGPDPSVVVD